jgi:hypothetical protein
VSTILVRLMRRVEYCPSVFDAGEEDASELTHFLLEPEGSKTAVMQLAQRYHGLAILLEHRYYGGVPYNLSQLVQSQNLEP